ncbi:receptor-like protein 2, partial [Lolium rigidum]|uniref:receptor-like protein 2 n=1 Tax=Lolium rigidum TaxID=89674 RepID=UPI001F5D62AB
TGYNNLGGTVPEELFNAASLEYLSFPNNNLHGLLDSARIINLRNLVTLDLGGNNFSGNILNSISELKRLEKLFLDNNNFSGELSKVNFSNLSNLKVLDLWSNNFTGTVPESMYSCSNMTALRLSRNNLHGQLSSSIGNMKYLSFLSLGHNNFTNITNAFHILKSSKNLTTLLIGHNFRGELMPEDDIIDGFENLQVLSFEYCELLGRIPLWISRLTNLEVLILNSNKLSGRIPDWINSLSHLFYVDVSDNRLTGEILLTLTEITMRKRIGNTIHYDPKVFKLPVYNGPSLQYCGVTSFPTVLNLSHNYFAGVIPPQIGRLKVLVVLDFSFNKLSGQIPQSICSLTNLQVLDLSSNNFTGEIPAALNSLHFLSAFNISNNDLEGPIPSGGQFDTFQSSSFDGNPELCGSMLIHKCDSADAHQAVILPRKHAAYKAAFVIAFGAFFGVGVMYDQLVLSRFNSIILFASWTILNTKQLSHAKSTPREPDPIPCLADVNQTGAGAALSREAGRDDGLHRLALDADLAPSRAGSWGGCKVRVEPNLREEVVDFDALGLVGVEAGVEERGMAAAS